jgi:hypothetical protein
MAPVQFAIFKFFIITARLCITVLHYIPDKAAVAHPFSERKAEAHFFPVPYYLGQFVVEGIY